MQEIGSIHTAHIALGSNLDNPLQQVNQALTEMSRLPDTRLTAASRMYRSVAIGPGKQPDYINAVATLVTQLPPEDLLDQLQNIELAHKRKRTEHWGPRTLDLDILLYDRQQLHTERLIVPHPRLCERNFVLYPLAEIAPDLVLPSGTTIESLLTQCSNEGLELIDDNLE